jgi:tetratricopeptide (TPR) repeat protein
MRKIAEAHRAKIERESADVHARFMGEVEANRLLMEGVFLASHHRSEEALEVFRRLVRIKPDLVMAWLRMGDVHREMEQFEEAMDCYSKALTLSPNDVRGSYSMAAVYAQQRNREKMLEYLRRVVADDGEFKDEALNDPAFREYWNDPAFKDIAEG